MPPKDPLTAYCGPITCLHTHCTSDNFLPPPPGKWVVPHLPTCKSRVHRKLYNRVILELGAIARMEPLSSSHCKLNDYSSLYRYVKHSNISTFSVCRYKCKNIQIGKLTLFSRCDSLVLTVLLRCDYFDHVLLRASRSRRGHWRMFYRQLAWRPTRSFRTWNGDQACTITPCRFGICPRRQLRCRCRRARPGLSTVI